jgi:hypothetical protein
MLWFFGCFGQLPLHGTLVKEGRFEYRQKYFGESKGIHHDD